MSPMQRILREPVLITGLVTAFFGLLVAFGVSLTDVQTGAVVTFLGVVMALLRALVTPSDEVVVQQTPEATSPVAGPAGPKAGVSKGALVDVSAVIPGGVEREAGRHKDEGGVVQFNWVLAIVVVLVVLIFLMLIGAINIST